jgi:adenine-specific DNA-methyltransferase
MDNLKMHSPNLTQDNIARIRELFPNCVTEARDEAGRLRLAVDFDQLKQELSESIVDGPQERYHLNWPGKREALLTANAPIAKTLRPCRDESEDFDGTENLFIEGDNLDALKLLQETYLGKVKMIYIDPPYNTGKDFVYADNFAENSEAFLKKSNQKDEEGNRLIATSESNGRFHSDWLSMMYPRLKLARNLLAEDGIIFISIDDNEDHNLKKTCDEVFGWHNFVAKYIHKNNSTKNQAKLVSVSTEYFYCYAKDKVCLKSVLWRTPKKGAGDIARLFSKLNKQGLELEEIENQIKEMYSRPKYAHLSRWNKVDRKGVFKDSDLSREGGPKSYTIKNPSTGSDCKIPERGWGKSMEELERLQELDLIWYGDENTPPGMKDYINPDDVSVPDNFWYYDNSVDTRWCKNTFGSLVFENPKPLEMLKNMVQMVHSNDHDIILDFFAGSATTAHAVMQLNAEDGGKRKFILVQLPEPCDEKSEAFKAGYKTIAEISKERIRRAGKKIKEEGIKEKEEGMELDTGFRVLKVDSSNMAEVYYEPDAIKQNELGLAVDNIKQGRTGEDLLFQVMLDWGVDLSLPIRREQIRTEGGGKNKTFEVFFVADTLLAACFDAGVNEELVKVLAERSPLRAVFRETGYASDAVKINVEQIFKQLSPGTEVRGI